MNDHPEEFEVLHIGQPGPDVLRVVVGQAIARPAVTEEFAGHAITANPLTVGPDSRIFEIVWTGFMQYQIAMESYGGVQGGEFVGNRGIFSELRDSRYLQQTRLESGWVQEIYGTLRHWTLPCLNHCIDVIGWREPTIRELFDFPLPKD